MSRRHLVTVSVIGVVLGLSLCVAMIATGQTFGQRCAAAYDRPSAAWERCVSRLSDGGPVYEENIGKVS